ncbi:hypothetical protein IEQ34_007096 [Dendrobium chrysotoxum]|uniref:Uncharacterized protein n=1 Tax=Dendrobium chrysotoxum TaxID=161865 RepID=A0AAV7GR56_DENCH|nr:hypothetical protein IEQ34_007096 [Dendrobium chrysotoxum]
MDARQKADVTWRSDRRLLLLESRVQDRHYMETGQKADVTWRSSRRPTSLGSQVQDRRHLEAGQKADITWRSGRRPTSLGGRAEDRRHSEVRCKTDVTLRSGRRPTSLGGCLIPFHRNHRRRLLHWYTDVLAASPSNLITLSGLATCHTIVVSIPSNAEHILTTFYCVGERSMPYANKYI